MHHLSTSQRKTIDTLDWSKIPEEERTIGKLTVESMALLFSNRTTASFLYHYYHQRKVEMVEFCLKELETQRIFFSIFDEKTKTVPFVDIMRTANTVAELVFEIVRKMYHDDPYFQKLNKETP